MTWRSVDRIGQGEADSVSRRKGQYALLRRQTRMVHANAAEWGHPCRKGTRACHHRVKRHNTGKHSTPGACRYSMKHRISPQTEYRGKISLSIERILTPPSIPLDPGSLATALMNSLPAVGRCRRLRTSFRITIHCCLRRETRTRRGCNRCCALSVKSSPHGFGGLFPGRVLETRR